MNTYNYLMQLNVQQPIIQLHNPHYLYDQNGHPISENDQTTIQNDDQINNDNLHIGINNIISPSQRQLQYIGTNNIPPPSPLQRQVADKII